MAMLAESRRKQKWTLNPRGKHWSEDNNKFGQKMLEKMGWTSGKGLGVKEQGITEHIRVRFKEDQAGIGFNKSDNDKEWTRQQTSFNDLLLQLQKDQNTETSEITEDDTKTLSGKSLELKSQYSRARVHYKKFTRGKDVNKYSTKDLANIFGKKELNDKYVIKSEDKMEDVVLDPIGATDNRAGVITIKAGNMVDYFKNKIFPIAVNVEDKSRIKSESENELEQYVGFGFKSNEVEAPDRNQKIAIIKEEIKNFDLHVPEKTKKSKKNKRSKKDKVDETTNSENSFSTCEKEKEKSEFAFENPCLSDVNKIDCEAQNEQNVKQNLELVLNDSYIKRKKSKKNKHKKSIEIITLDLNNDCVNSVVIKKEEKGNFAFENPCLLDVNKIDSETQSPNKQKNDIEIVYENIDIETSDEIKNLEKVKRKKKRDKIVALNTNGNSEESTNFTFENPCLVDVDKIDNEVQNTRKRKSVIEDFGGAKKAKKVRKKNKESDEFKSIENQEDENNKFDFENPCLADVKNIEKEVKPDKLKKIKCKKNFEILNSNECFTNNALNLEISVDESNNGTAFEVPRKKFGLVNNALDLTDETPGKKRVTFNDKVEYNTDVEKKKKSKIKLDKYEVENVKLEKKKKIMDKRSRDSFRHSKKELKSFFYKSPVLEFVGSNVNELKGYGCEM